MITDAGWQSFGVYDTATGESKEYWVKSRVLTLDDEARVRRLLVDGLPWREAGPKEKIRLLWNGLRRQVARLNHRASGLGQGRTS